MKWPTIHLSVTELLEGVGTKISWEESMKLEKKNLSVEVFTCTSHETLALIEYLQFLILK